MKKLHKYLIQQFIGPFFAVLFVVVFALALEFLWVYIDELVGKGLGLGVIFEFMAWASATLLPLALPLATLLASIMTLGNLGERNELLAMKAAGISLSRILVPLFAVSLLISIGAFFASNNLVPVAYNKIYSLRADIARTKNEIKIPTGTFYDGIDGYVLRIESRDDDGMMHNLIIYDHTGYHGNTNMILAESGKINTTGNKTDIIFDLYNGCSYQEENNINLSDTAVELSRISFDYQRIIIPLENYSFSRSDDNEFGNEVMARNLRELVHDKDSITHIIDSLKNFHYDRFISSTGLVHMSQLDTSASKNRYTEGIDIDKVYSIVRSHMPEKYASYSGNFTIIAGKRNLRDYAPVYYSASRSKSYINDHYKYVTKNRPETGPLVTNLSGACTPNRGLNGAHIALWASHGLYFERSLDRWEWQFCFGKSNIRFLCF